ncbi:hypothetical protein [Candidatus Phytoplasma pruni]|uniref:Uncharacterized protein n=1 Tax=Candidatus Phytoplasma pruni TaxID=479893 RepID=A0A851HGR5_9MOLU|nr:hypothetical protein [Candidatus Phytoplasma pruni]NWN45820.1 hypothetical protein [Candidatus Phytoplasma pruni]
MAMSKAKKAQLVITVVKWVVRLLVVTLLVNYVVMTYKNSGYMWQSKKVNYAQNVKMTLNEKMVENKAYVKALETMEVTAGNEDDKKVLQEKKKAAIAEGVALAKTLENVKTAAAEHVKSTKDKE